MITYKSVDTTTHSHVACYSYSEGIVLSLYNKFEYGVFYSVDLHSNLLKTLNVLLQFEYLNMYNDVFHKLIYKLLNFKLLPIVQMANTTFIVFFFLFWVNQ